ncbi:MAG: carboxy-S-adenosyl-L-methionine synthase CmoA [Halobacteriovorax sp.]|nr:carboxy-S-adenosyl-L-methionine synthase CmoA [Halobacteriovorax sp.]
MRDEIFGKKNGQIENFSFNQEVAAVFDDMVERSIPNYGEVHRIVADMVRRYLASGATVYDLGCSTGSTMVLMHNTAKQENKVLNLIGVDASKAMLEKCSSKLKEHHVKAKLIEGDLLDLDYESCDMIVMDYTLQFIPLEQRSRLLSKLFQALKPGGRFVLAEKIASSNPKIQEMITDLYYDFKRRNGYSELEISQKREALENVMTPLTPTQQISMLEVAGFTQVDMVFRWYNFAAWLAIK